MKPNVGRVACVTAALFFSCLGCAQTASHREGTRLQPKSPEEQLQAFQESWGLHPALTAWSSARFEKTFERSGANISLRLDRLGGDMDRNAATRLQVTAFGHDIEIPKVIQNQFTWPDLDSITLAVLDDEKSGEIENIDINLSYGFEKDQTLYNLNLNISSAGPTIFSQNRTPTMSMTNFGPPIPGQSQPKGLAK